jgi:hypothetical protein
VPDAERQPKYSTPEKLEWAMQQVEGWDERTQESPTVLPASELGRDSEGFPAMPLAQLTWRSLVTAVEHLALLVDAVRRTDAVWPRAYASLVRTALLGSAQAAWMLHPEDTRQRVTRGVVLARDEYVQMRKLTTELLQDDAVSEEDRLSAATAKEEAEAFQKTAEDKLSQLGVSPKREAAATAIILETAKLLDTPTETFHHGVLAVWRYSSGVVHAKAWHGDIMPPLQDPEEQLLWLLASPVLTTQLAFQLWDCRTQSA